MKKNYITNHLFISFKKPKYYRNPCQHIHPDLYEMSYCLKGEKKYTIRDNKYILNNSSLILIDKNNFHEYEHNRNSDACSIHFTKDFLGTETIEAYSHFDILSIFSLKKKVYDFSNNSFYRYQIENNIKSILHDVKTDQLSLYKARNCITDILLLIHKFIKNRNINQNTTSEIVEFISENFHKEINLNLIALKFGINYKTLSKKIITETGKTFSQYLNQLRIEKSKNILKDTERSIISACFESGYNDLCHFNKMFKKLTGLTPKQYKKSSISE